MRHTIIAILFAFTSTFAAATNLFPCPDCEQPVSPRAVMCPHCGCPGEAIAEAVAMRDAATKDPPPQPLVRVATEHHRGCAVAFTEGDRYFLMMDAMLLSDTASLQLTPLATNTPIAYRNMQIAQADPLVRFETDATNLMFLTRSRYRLDATTALYWLIPHEPLVSANRGEVPSQEAATLVDAQTNLVGIVSMADGRSVITPIPKAGAWRDVAPRVFREQMALLARAAQEAQTPPVSDETLEVLRGTKWASAFLEKRARQISQGTKEDRKP